MSPLDATLCRIVGRDEAFLPEENAHHRAPDESQPTLRSIAGYGNLKQATKTIHVTVIQAAS